MYLSENFEQYDVREVSRSDGDDLEALIDLINAGGQLSWTLTVPRLLQKIGTRGRIFGLFGPSGAAGVIALKQTPIGVYNAAEIGYLYVDPEARSYQAVAELYKAALKVSHKYDFVFGTTNSKNRTINTLLNRSARMRYVFKAKSPYSSNILFYWLVVGNTGNIGDDEQEDALRGEYQNNIIQEGDVMAEGFFDGLSDFYQRMKDAAEEFVAEKGRVHSIQLQIEDPTRVRQLVRKIRALVAYKQGSDADEYFFDDEESTLIVTNAGVTGIYINGFLKALRQLSDEFDFRIIKVN